jgi:hypothetical protein
MKMVRYAATSLLALLSCLLALAFTAAPAQAQATRTWVSGVGDDVNPCSRTAPCKTFAGAISKTANGGEINCLDPGGFGTLTITKSITIDCTGTLGSTLNSGGINGFVINDSATATPGTVKVILRGVTVDGAGSTPGLNGVRFVSGRSLYMEDVFIQNQNSGFGVSLSPSGGTTVSLVMRNVSMVEGGSGATGGGISITLAGSLTTVNATLDNVTIAGTGQGTGVRIDTTGATNGTGVRMTIDNSSISQHQTGISVTRPGGASAAFVAVSDSILNGNTTAVATTGSVEVRLSGNVISHNTTGTSPGTGFISSNGDNEFFANGSDGTFNPPGVVAKK